jgi:hypothetical protein
MANVVSFSEFKEKKKSESASQETLPKMDKYDLENKRRLEREQEERRKHNEKVLRSYRIK